jgi:hypothetical protein
LDFTTGRVIGIAFRSIEEDDLGLKALSIVGDGSNCLGRESPPTGFVELVTAITVEEVTLVAKAGLTISRDSSLVGIEDSSDGIGTCSTVY